MELVRQYGPIYGTYNLFEPVVNISELSLVKQVMIKDFHLFVNRRVLPAWHEMANSNLFFVEDGDWKRMRSIASPSFSAVKLRKMHALVDRSINKLTTFLDQSIEKGNTVLNGKDIMMGYTLDVVMSALFATETNANEGDREKNPVLQSMLKGASISAFQALSYLTMPPWFNNLVKCQHLFNYDTVDMMERVVSEVIRQRKGKPTKQNDLLQLLLEASVTESELSQVNYANLEIGDNSEENSSKLQPDSEHSKAVRKLTDTEIISNCMLFFGAGNDTSATTLANVLFELVNNPDIQERLHKELEEALDGLDTQSEAYYEKVMLAIPYLDAVIKETLRKYSPLKRVERRVSVDGYTLGGVALKKDQLVEVMIYAIHYNPDFYPDPQRFSPERFLPKSKHLLVPNTYLPFGIGPRNCIGMRFAYQNIKFCLAKLLLDYQIEATPETPTYRLCEPFAFTVVLKGYPIKISKR